MPAASEGEKLCDNSTKATYPARNRRGRRHMRKGHTGSCRVGCSASRHSRLRVPNAGSLLPDVRPTLNRKWIDATGRIRWPEQYGFAETPGADRRRYVTVNRMIRRRSYGTPQAGSFPDREDRSRGARVRKTIPEAT